MAKRQADEAAKIEAEVEAPEVAKRPGCGCHRCNAKHTVVTRGVRHTMQGTVRYVTCPDCGWVFSTIQPHGTQTETVLSP